MVDRGLKENFLLTLENFLFTNSNVPILDSNTLSLHVNISYSLS